MSFTTPSKPAEPQIASHCDPQPKLSNAELAKLTPKIYKLGDSDECLTYGDGRCTPPGPLARACKHWADGFFDPTWYESWGPKPDDYDAPLAVSAEPQPCAQRHTLPKPPEGWAWYVFESHFETGTRCVLYRRFGRTHSDSRPLSQAAELADMGSRVSPRTGDWLAGSFGPKPDDYDPLPDAEPLPVEPAKPKKFPYLAGRFEEWESLPIPQRDDCFASEHAAAVARQHRKEMAAWRESIDPYADIPDATPEEIRTLNQERGT